MTSPTTTSDDSAPAEAVVLTVDAVLFDLDGTLVDSTASIHRTWRDWGSRVGLGDSFTFTGHGRPAIEVVAELLPAEQVEAAVALIQELKVADARSVVALPGAAELLASIPPASRALVTSSTTALAAARLRGAGLPAFTTTITADDVHHGKPDPEGYLAAAAALGVEPHRCLVLEDAPAGLEAARHAGMRTLALTTTHAASELVADQVVDGLRRVAVAVTAGGLTATIHPS